MKNKHMILGAFALLLASPVVCWSMPERPEAGTAASLAASGPALARTTPVFEAEITPDQNMVRVRVGGQEVLRLTNKYLLRLRCDPSKDMWLGYDYAEIHLGWNPNQFPAVNVSAVDVRTIGDRVTIAITGEKPDYPGSRFQTSVTGELDDGGLIRYTIGSELRFGSTTGTPGNPRRVQGVEFLDVWVDRIFWPENFQNRRELYQHFVFGTPSGIVRAPKLHVYTDTPSQTATFETLGQAIEEGSFFAVVDEAEGGFQFRFDRLSLPGSIGICWWTWDPHFIVNRYDTTESLSYSVTIESLSAPEARGLVEQAKPIRFRKDPDYQVPTFYLDHTNDFRARVAKSSDWVWERTSTDARLDREVGYDDRASATIQIEGEGRHAWYSRILWQDPWSQRPIHGRYRLSAMVRTRGVQGQARIGIMQADGPELLLYREPSPIFSYSQAITGDTEWQEYSFDFMAIWPKLKVVLEQEGAGRSWFDNVRVAALCDPIADEAPRVAFHSQDHGALSVRRFDLWSMTESWPGVVGSGLLNLVWPDSWAGTPEVTLEPGMYQLVIHARGGGCAADSPALLVEGPPGLAQVVTIRPDASDDYIVAFTLRKRQAVSFRLTAIRDGVCGVAGSEIDKNVFVRALTLAGPTVR
jgi:hypothetical protein